MDTSGFISGLSTLASDQQKIADMAKDLADQAQSLVLDGAANAGGGHGFFIMGLTIFVLACFVGYYVVWHVTPALHSPLMAVTNAVSSVIVVGALLAAAAAADAAPASRILGLAAVLLASINIFGGFIVTQRMLQMFQKKGK